MEAEAILAGHDLPRGSAGSMTAPQFNGLLPILARHTSATDSWFLLWDGFGDLNPRAFPEHGPKVRHPMRDYYLLRGPHRGYADFPDDPNYWWPADRAWCGHRHRLRLGLRGRFSGLHQGDNRGSGPRRVPDQARQSRALRNGRRQRPRWHRSADAVTVSHRATRNHQPAERRSVSLWPVACRAPDAW